MPYPAKKPWPNPLDPADAKIDHDGDGLYLDDEFLLWKFYGNNALPLNYSAGLQRSIDADAPTDPLLAYMDGDGDGKLSDDERDADGDKLPNFSELYGAMTQTFWDNTYNGSNGLPKETRYPNTFPDVSHVDPDSDGDGVLDGDDDQDHDGLSNAFEHSRPAFWPLSFISQGHNSGDLVYPFAAGWNPWARVQPYNPCKPVWSHTCHLHPPHGYYPTDEDWIGIPASDAGPRPAAPWLYP